MEKISRITPKTPSKNDHEVIMEKLYLILEAVSDRVEMHKNVGEQRNDWSNLLLTSINTITLSAATMVAIAAAISTPHGLKNTIVHVASVMLWKNSLRLLFAIHGCIWTYLYVCHLLPYLQAANFASAEDVGSFWSRWIKPDAASQVEEALAPRAARSSKSYARPFHLKG